MLNIYKMYEIFWFEMGWLIGWGRGYVLWLFMFGKLFLSDGLNIIVVVYYLFMC